MCICSFKNIYMFIFTFWKLEWQISLKHHPRGWWCAMLSCIEKRVVIRFCLLLKTDVDKQGHSCSIWWATDWINYLYEISYLSSLRFSLLDTESNHSSKMAFLLSWSYYNLDGSGHYTWKGAVTVHKRNNNVLILRSFIMETLSQSSLSI